MKTKVDAKTRKARKQKMFIAVGGLVLLVLLVIQVPRTMKLLKSPEPATVTASPTQTATQGAGGAAVPISAEGGTVTGLPDRNDQPDPGEGQLVSFELFASKDPFVQQVNPLQPGTVAPGNGAGSGEAPATGEPGTAEEVAPSSATIAVNGAKEAVAVGAEFPSEDPAFVLVRAGKRSVDIGIAGGSLASGDATVTLRLGKTLTLVNTADGTEYRLKLISVG